MVAIRFEQIMPEPYKEGIIRLYLLNELRRFGAEIRKDFLATVSTWETKPRFPASSVSLAGGVMSVEVWTEDENYIRLNDGVPARPIVVSDQKKALRFPGTFMAKTSPGVIGSSAGAKGPYIYRKHAKSWSGIRARKFDEAIQSKWEGALEDRFQRVLDRAAEKTGYTI